MNELLYLLLTVPTITAFIGWLTNWAAVKMIFFPTRFVGVGPLGWQAIIVKQGPKFATGVADMVTENLVTAEELAGKLDPNEIEALFADVVERETPGLCEEAAEVVQPGSWSMLPEPARDMVIAQVRSQSSGLARDLFSELRGRANDLMDLHGLVYRELSGQNVDRLSRLTQKIGKKEFKFIEWSGGVFGFIIGMGQIAVWKSMQLWWVMPIFGVVTGLITNWLAIQMIFRPLEQKRYLGIPYQGLFPKRQDEISRDYGETAKNEILTPQNFIRMITEGERGRQITEIVTTTIRGRVESEWAKVAPMVPVQVTPEMMDTIQAKMVARFAGAAPEVMPRLESYIEKKLEVGSIVETRLAALSKGDFERILRGIFEEDELTLIIVGGFLGGAVGCLQAFLVLLGT
jgi:uncharacterized membrane protein YheB (UPF0754 family)